MIAHKDFESDCKRIAKEIMKIVSDPSNDQFDDAICFGRLDVYISLPLVIDVNKERYKYKKKWEKEINKHLKGCSITLNGVGTGRGWFISFNIEFDDVDAETEDW